MEYSQLLRDYLDDAEELVAAFDSALLRMEDGARTDMTNSDMTNSEEIKPEVINSGVINSALGALHTLKGNSGMMGYNSLKDFIHHLEEVLKRILEGKLKIEGGLPPLLEGSGVLKKALRDIEKSPSSPPELKEFIIDLDSLLLNGSLPPEHREGLDLESYLGARTDTVKVSFRKLDDLLSLVGELVITKTRLGAIESALREDDEKEKALVLKEVLESAGKTVSGLQEGIMRARMVPVGTLFRKFTRMARDLARAQGKEVNIVFQGEETELDKTVIDELAKPLLHLVRNAMDHGIETPAERVEKGKPAEGRLTLTSFQESNYIYIRVEDDGKGMEPEEIRKKALKMGLLKEEDAPTEGEVLDLVFQPGFSMREESTDISGRGIGLDAAAKNIARLNGLITLHSRPGRGSAFLIKLPLSLAIIPALMAEVAGEVFAIPISAVEESIKAHAKDIHRMNLREVAMIREKLIPVLRLADFFNLRGESGDGKIYLVIAGRGEKRVALAVDRLRGQQEIVIKPLDESFGRSRGISGASILGDGRIVLILDIPGLWDEGLLPVSEKGPERAGIN